jgi:hypothetical protein
VIKFYLKKLSQLNSQTLQNTENMNLDSASPNPCFLQFAKDKIVKKIEEFLRKCIDARVLHQKKFDKNE